MSMEIKIYGKLGETSVEKESYEGRPYNIEARTIHANRNTVIILNIGTDMSEQTVQTQIRLLLMEQSDQGLLCLLFCLHLLNTILHCKIQPFQL